jgi:hypothetical protein
MVGEDWTDPAVPRGEPAEPDQPVGSGCACPARLVVRRPDGTLADFAESLDRLRDGAEPEGDPVLVTNCACRRPATAETTNRQAARPTGSSRARWQPATEISATSAGSGCSSKAETTSASDAGQARPPGSTTARTPRRRQQAASPSGGRPRTRSPVR